MPLGESLLQRPACCQMVHASLHLLVASLQMLDAILHLPDACLHLTNTNLHLRDANMHLGDASLHLVHADLQKPLASLQTLVADLQTAPADMQPLLQARHCLLQIRGGTTHGTSALSSENRPLEIARLRNRQQLRMVAALSHDPLQHHPPPAIRGRLGQHPEEGPAPDVKGARGGEQHAVV